MKISAKGRYAVCFMTDLAEHAENGCISLKEISERQNISKKYLEQIIPVLKKGGLLLANRGSQGGYALAKKAEKITVGDILRLTEGSLATVDFAGEQLAGEMPLDVTMKTVWQGLSDVINEYLDGITLQSIVDRQREHYANDYVI